MALFRVAWRSAGLFLVTVGLYSLYLPGRALLLIMNKEPAKWRNFIIGNWAASCAHIMGLQIEIEGRPPEAPFFLVSNHLSYIDILPFFIHLDCIFVAKSEVSSWPIIGPMAEGMNIIFINRQMKRDIPRVNRLIRDSINEHHGVIIFPEGTTTCGDRVEKFNSSLLNYAASNRFPVSYASISYETFEADKQAHEWVCWWGDTGFSGHFLRLLTLRGFRAEVTFGNRQVQSDDRKHLAEKLEQQVRTEFAPIVKSSIQ